MKSSNLTYCNPLPLPNYPLGFACRKDNMQNDPGYLAPPCDFRESADPEVIFFDGKWYMYPSCGMAYCSSDLLHWEYAPVAMLDGAEAGYAPTVTYCNDKFLLTASGGTSVFTAPGPLGPFKELGPMKDPNGKKVDGWLDPMLFTDTDGRLYAYWGFSPDGGGIKGAEVDANQPDQLLTEPEVFIDFNPEHEWERFGDANEHNDWSFVEGASMFKYKSAYYLIYAGCGTLFRNYAVGCYKSDSPLGPFVYQQTSPIALKNHGIVNGTGHGCLANGPDGSVWLFYTSLIRRLHHFERRIGMDRCEFDAAGNILPIKISDTPQTISGEVLDLRQVTINKPVKVSSFYGNNFGAYAVDAQTNTWWEPEAADKNPWLKIDFRRGFEVSSCRIMWTENGLNARNGIMPVPVKFKLELFNGTSEEPVAVIDHSDNERDMIIEYFTFDATIADRAKVTIIKTQTAINHGICDVTIFGHSPQ